MFVPKAKVWHKRRGSTDGQILALNVYFSVRNRILFAKKHANNLEFAFFILYFAAVEFPHTVINLLIAGKRQYVSLVIKGVVWNLRKSLSLTDSQMIEILRH